MSNQYVFLRPGERLFVITGPGSTAGVDDAVVYEVNFDTVEGNGRKYFDFSVPTVNPHEKLELNQVFQLAEVPTTVLEDYARYNELRLKQSETRGVAND